MTGGPAVAWTAEWRTALLRRRLLVLDLLVPLLVVAALLLGGAPSHHAAAVVAVLFVVFAVFGSAIPLVRDGGSGLLLRWLLAGLPPRGLLSGRLLAQAALDLLQLAPAAAMVAAGAPSGADLEAAGAVAGGLAVALLAGNALGAWVAAAARSLAEAALFAALAALLLLHAGGVFRTPAPGSWQAAVEAVVPFRPLHEALLGALGTPAGEGAGWGPPLLATAAFLVATHLLAPTLLGALSRAEEG